MIRSGETARGKRRGSWLMSENGENWENSVQGLSVLSPPHCRRSAVRSSSLGLLLVFSTLHPNVHYSVLSSACRGPPKTLTRLKKETDEIAQS